MAATFSVTMRSLERHAPRRVSLALGLAGALLLGLWGSWVVVARVGMYVSTNRARLEVTEMAHRVAAPEDGRVASLAPGLEIGRWVEEGTVLLELDTRVEAQRLEESRARVAVCGAKKSALERQIAAERRVSSLQTSVDEASVRRAQADVTQLEVSAKFEDGLQNISERLHAEQLASTKDLLGARRDTAEARSRAETARRDVHRAAATKKYDEGRTLATIAELERQLVDLDAESSLARAAVDTAAAQIDRRKIRAPVRGKLGSIAALQVGDVVRATDAIATIVPQTDIHAVAEFAPSDVVGRVVPGQPARLRLTGFAWTRFGAIDATVKRVAVEPRDGTVRVELDIHAGAGQAIPIQHGLPGSAEIEIGRVAPWRIVMEAMAPVAATPDPATPLAAGAAQ